MTSGGRTMGNFGGGGGSDSGGDDTPVHLGMLWEILEARDSAARMNSRADVEEERATSHGRGLEPGSRGEI